MQFVGEIISRGLSIPVPGNVIGMALLFLALVTGVVPLGSIKEASELLLSHMALFFIPAGVGVMVYFDLLARFEARTADPETATEHEQACAAEADRIMDAMTGAIQHGIDDGSIRPDLNPSHTAITLWGYTHGLIQLAIHKRTDLERQYGLDAETLVANGLDFAGVGLTGHAPSTAPAPPPGLFPDEKSET